MTVEDHTKVRPWRMIDRRTSRQIHVGDVAVGGDAPISVQSMTNTLTSDANATINQIRALEEAGADIVRVSCPDTDSTAAFKTIAKAAKVPLVADIHFHYKRGIEAAEAGPPACGSIRAISARWTGCAMWFRPRAIMGAPSVSA
jgi:(E)-4-hydroxy-3-methylbut-2-enyl-diphosphate synthase